MKQYILLFLTLLLLCSLPSKAGPVTAEQAREKAAAFFSGQQAAGARRRAPAARQMRLAAQGRDATYYIFNAPTDDGGYVVVSGDDATTDILGYSNTGAIDANDIPCNMQMLLDSYAKQIKFLRNNGISRKQNRSTGKASSKSFHLEKSRLAKFDQKEPYNNLCPKDVDNNNTVTGCVATAMAELMYYHKWPSQTTNTIPGYTSKTKKLPVEAVPANTQIDWSNIISQYNTYYLSDILGDWLSRELWDNDEQANAIANLMIIAGTSIHMDYGKSSLGYDFFVPYALKKYFGYESADRFKRPNAGDNWNDLLCTELETNGPVVYSGDDENGEGHTFMLEGYSIDTDYYYDVNFGWDGRGNGKYLLTVVEDDFTFTSDQTAILNVKPKSVLEPTNFPLSLKTNGFQSTDKYVYPRFQPTGQFEQVKLWAKLRNETPVDAYFDIGFRFFDGESGKTVKDIVVAKNVSMKSLGKNGRGGEDVRDENDDYQDGLVYTFSVPSDIPDGAYLVYCISKESNTTEWLENDYMNGLKDVGAVICKDKLAFTSDTEDNSKLQLKDVFQTSTSALRKGYPSEFVYTIKNLDDIWYYGDYILVFAEWEKGDKEMPIEIDELQVQAGSHQVSSFSFTPPKAGDIDIVFYKKNWEIIDRVTVTAIPADESLDLLEVENLTIANQNDDGSIDGTYLKGSITMHNLDNVAKNEQLLVSLEDMETSTIIKTKSMQVNIAPDETVTYYFMFTNLTLGRSYRVIAKYNSGEILYESSPMLCKDEDTGETIEGNEDLAFYEYWFDDNYERRVIVPLSNNRISVKESVDTELLTDGIHRLNFRVKRNDGWYSAVNTSTFLKLPKEQEGHLDYWIDDDRENIKTLPLADTEDEQLLALDLSDDAFCGQGNHRLNIQVATKGSVMGTVHAQSVLKLSEGVATQLEYWFDNNRAGAQRLTGKRAEGGEPGFIYNTDLDLSTLTPGVHRLNMRPISPSRQTAGSVMTKYVVKLSTGRATQLEYWFDDNEDKSLRLNGQLCGGDTLLYDYSLDMRSLTPGLHRLNMRATAPDGSNKGPLVTCRVFKLATGKATQLEYWFDDDQANSKRLDGRASGKDYIFDQDLDLSGLSTGLHQLNMRATAADGSNISPLVTCRVLKLVSGNVQKLEYWFDGDMAHSRTMSGSGAATGTEGILFADDLDLRGIAPGHHRLYYRAIGNDGQTTTAISAAAIMVKSEYGADGTATMASYSIVVDDKTVAYGSLSARQEVEFSYVLDASDLEPGSSHVLKTTFWNSFGTSVTELTPFLVKASAGDSGDSNGDGKVDVADIATILSVMAGTTTGPAAVASDVNNDGKVDVADIATVLSIMAQLARQQAEELELE